MWTYTLLCGRIRELIVAKALDSRGQGRELAATLKLQAWQVKNHLTWARRFSMAELVAALEAAVDVELALKGSADSETALLLSDYEHLEKIVMIPAYLTNSFYPFEGSVL